MSKHTRVGKRLKSQSRRKPPKNQTWVFTLLKRSLFSFSDSFSPRLGKRSADALGYFLIGLALIELYRMAPPGFMSGFTGTFLESLFKYYLKI